MSLGSRASLLAPPNQELDVSPAWEEDNPMMEMGAVTFFRKRLSAMKCLLKFTLAAGPALACALAAQAAVTIDFENTPAVTGRPNNFAAAGPGQGYTNLGVYDISGGVVLSNPVVLASFAANGTPPNQYATADYADPSLGTNSGRIVLDLPTGATNVQGVLFNGQPQPEDYEVDAWSGPVLLSSNRFPQVPEAFRSTSFATFNLSTTPANPITKVVIYPPNAASNGWDFALDTIQASVLSNLPPYVVWRWAHFTAAELTNPAISGDLACPTGDGIPNIWKYALALDPHVFSANQRPSGALQNGFLTLTYQQNKAATDMGYSVEACGDLLAAAWATNGVLETARFDSNTWWQVTARDGPPVAGGTNRFMRLRITGPKY
jgi:hypothetical protein